MKDFKEFLLRGNLVELAVAVVIGVAFAALVNSFVTDLVTPLIAAIGGKQDFSALTLTINDSVFRYGAFVNALLSFLIIAAVVYYFVVKPGTCGEHFFTADSAEFDAAAAEYQAALEAEGGSPTEC